MKKLLSILLALAMIAGIGIGSVVNASAANPADIFSSAASGNSTAFMGAQAADGSASNSLTDQQEYEMLIILAPFMPYDRIIMSLFYEWRLFSDLEAGLLPDKDLVELFYDSLEIVYDLVMNDESLFRLGRLPTAVTETVNNLNSLFAEYFTSDFLSTLSAFIAIQATAYRQLFTLEQHVNFTPMRNYGEIRGLYDALGNLFENTYNNMLVNGSLAQQTEYFTNLGADATAIIARIDTNLAWWQTINPILFLILYYIFFGWIWMA